MRISEKPGTSTKGRIISLAIGCLLSALVGEGLLRLVMPHWDEFFSGRFMTKITAPDNSLVMIGRAGFDGYFSQNNGDFRVQIAINKSGFRNPEPIEEAAGKIWVIGDSMAFGWGVERQQTYTEVIERELGQGAYNVASPGTDVCGYQSLMSLMPKTVRPRAVIVGLIMENDMRVYDCAAKRSADHPQKEKTWRPTFMNAKRFLTKYSALYNTVVVSLKRVNPINEALIVLGLANKPHAYRRGFPAEKVGEIAASTADELARLKSMAPRDIPFAVLITPARFDLMADDPVYREMRLKATREIRARGIVAIDPYEAFKEAGSKPTHFVHDGHWSPLGHEIAGKAAATWLRTRLPAS